MSDKSSHYVDNDKFFDAMCSFIEACQELRVSVVLECLDSVVGICPIGASVAKSVADVAMRSRNPTEIVKILCATGVGYDDSMRVADAILSRKSAGELRPKIPDYIAECVWLIATNLAKKPNFVMNPYRDDMVSEAVSHCLTYIDRFDPMVSEKPFAYFTQICYRAFLHVIKDEHEHAKTTAILVETQDPTCLGRWNEYKGLARADD